MPLEIDITPSTLLYFKKKRARLTPDRQKVWDTILQGFGELGAISGQEMVDRMVREKFFTYDEIRKLVRNKRKEDRHQARNALELYPWSGLKPGHIARLEKMKEVKEIDSILQEFTWYGKQPDHAMGLRMMGALFYWMRSKQRALIRVDKKSAFLLGQVISERQRLGKPVLDWREKLTPSSLWYEQGIMLEIDTDPEQFTFAMQSENTMTYISWTKIANKWGTYASVNLAHTAESMLAMYDSMLKGAVKTSMLAAENNMENEEVRLVETWKTVPHLVSAFNLLCSMNSASPFQILRQQRTDNRGRAQLGLIRNVVPYEIVYEELEKWSDYFIQIKPPRNE